MAAVAKKKINNRDYRKSSNNSQGALFINKFIGTGLI